MKVVFVLSLLAGVALCEYCTPGVGGVCNTIVQCSGDMIPTCEYNLCSCIDKPEPKECVLNTDCSPYFQHTHHCSHTHQKCQNNHCVCVHQG